MKILQSAVPSALLLLLTLGMPTLSAPAGEKARAAATPRTEAAAAQPQEQTTTPPSEAMERKFRLLQAELGQGGAAKPEGEAVIPENPSGMASAFFKTLFGLVFVLILMVFTLRFLKRLQRKVPLAGRTGNSEDIMEVLEVCHVGPQHKVVALRVRGEALLLGMGPQGLSLLKEMDASPDLLVGRTSQPGDSNSQTFAESLDRLMDRFKKPKRVSDVLKEM